MRVNARADRSTDLELLEVERGLLLAHAPGEEVDARHGGRDGALHHLSGIGGDAKNQPYI